MTRTATCASRRAPSLASFAKVASLFLLLSTCRDAPDPFEPPELPPLGPTPYQLTFGIDSDASPTWASSGDTVYYLREFARDDPGQPGDTASTTKVLYALPPEGGTAIRVLSVLQPPGAETLSIDRAAVSVDSRVAMYVRLPLHGPPCPGAESVCTTETDLPPMLRAGAIRIRGAGSVSAPSEDLQVVVEHPGRRFDTSDPPDGVDGVYVTELFPFQRLFNDTGRLPSRLSWSPDGQRLVYSDGISLRIWTLASGAVTSIPNTEGGIEPAWSPQGDLIVFERLERGGATTSDCLHRFGETVQCVERRIEYAFPSSSLAVVRPDGSSLRLLPVGTAPAWSHDGRRVFYESDGSIWSLEIDGAEAQRLDGTDGGREPAPSPDGRFVAFSRVDPQSGSADIWVVDAPQD